LQSKGATQFSPERPPDDRNSSACARPGGPGQLQPAEPAKQTTAGCRVFA
jgi:hypothetical protein